MSANRCLSNTSQGSPQIDAFQNTKTCNSFIKYGNSFIKYGIGRKIFRLYRSTKHPSIPFYWFDGSSPCISLILLEATKMSWNLMFPSGHVTALLSPCVWQTKRNSPSGTSNMSVLSTREQFLEDLREPCNVEISEALRSRKVFPIPEMYPFSSPRRFPDCGSFCLPVSKLKRLWVTHMRAF